jgi:uncharacterized protein YhfF
MAWQQIGSGADPMTNDMLLELFPNEVHRHFAPMKVGSTVKDADEGAELIIAGVKTATSSAHWHYRDGQIPFVGASSVVVDGADRPRGVVETVRVEHVAFSAVDASFASAYGAGPRTLEWWRDAIGDWYRSDAARHGRTFDVDTVIICEWFRLIARFPGT